jgi:hypothetical protein
VGKKVKQSEIEPEEVLELFQGSAREGPVLLHNYQPLTYGHCWRSRVSQCSVVSLSQVQVRVWNVERCGIVADTRRARWRA